ncbi:MAG: type ISP restriction/modification enzyme [Promethearchaeota archaeon]
MVLLSIKNPNSKFPGSTIALLDPDKWATFSRLVGKMHGLLESICTDKETIADDIAQVMVLFHIIRESCVIPSTGDEIIDVLSNFDLKILDFLDISLKEADIRNFSFLSHTNTINSQACMDLEWFLTFYEDFLQIHDMDRKKHHGAYYTPVEVVNFITRSIDEILTREFKLVGGLADEMVRVIDPATGTGMFLRSAFELVLQRSRFADQKTKVKKHLLNDFIGYEIMLMPAIISKIQLATILKKEDLLLKDADKIPVKISNFLATRKSFDFQDRGHETVISSNSDTHTGIDDACIVIMGNPPYSVSSANKTAFLSKLMDDYKTGLVERNIQPLSDDYIKFMRYAQWQIEQKGSGVIGFVVNNAFIYKMIYRQMRHSLLSTFDKIFVVNLHGNSNIGETTPDGKKDENIFPIKVGVAIVLMIKKKQEKTKRRPSKELHRQCSVFYSEIFGLRHEKLEFLKNRSIYSMLNETLNPRAPHYFFIKKDMSLEKEYMQYPSLTDIFDEYIIGVKTHRDDFIVEFEKEAIVKKIKELVSNTPDQAIKEKFVLKDDLNVISHYRRHLRETGIDETRIIPYSYRVFDDRWIYYDDAIITRNRKKIMSCMLSGKNIAIITTRLLSSRRFDHCFVSNKVGDIGILSSRTSESAYYFPLYKARPISKRSAAFNKANVDSGSNGICINIKEKFIQEITNKFPSMRITPKDIFGYIYAVLHMKAYRDRYLEFLKIDFPRIPFVDNPEIFKRIGEIGKKLVDIHLLKVQDSVNEITKLETTRPFTLRSFRHDPKKKIVYLNDMPIFKDMPPDIWKFSIGSYAVLKKWLRSRKNKPLRGTDLVKFASIANAIRAVEKIKYELDSIEIL